MIVVTKEVWRDIPGWEGSYQISNLERVKSLKRTIIRTDGKPYPVKERILALRDYRGDMYATLYEHYRGRTLKVKALVAEAFPELTQADVSHLGETDYA